MGWRDDPNELPSVSINGRVETFGGFVVNANAPTGHVHVGWYMNSQLVRSGESQTGVTATVPAGG